MTGVKSFSKFDGPLTYRLQIFSIERSKSLKTVSKFQEAGSILRVGFALSKRPHFDSELFTKGAVCFALNCNSKYKNTQQTHILVATQRILSLKCIFVNRNCEYFYQKSGQKVIRKKYFRTILCLGCYLYFLYSHPCRLEHAHFRFLSIELSTLDKKFFITANIF